MEQNGSIMTADAASNKQAKLRVMRTAFGMRTPQSSHRRAIPALVERAFHVARWEMAMAMLPLLGMLAFLAGPWLLRCARPALNYSRLRPPAVSL